MNTTLGHIHLVDDDPDVRCHLGDLLRQLGYSVEAHAHAEVFLQAAPRPQAVPTAVLMDVRMPGLSGVQAQARWRAMGRHTPIVFISGNSLPQEIVDGMKGGAVDFLFKPFKCEQLVAAVDKALALDAQAQARRVRLQRVQRAFATLTKREAEVFVLVLQGHSNLSIGAISGVQAGTIKKHRAAVLAKFGVDTVAELMGLCHEVGPEELVQRP